MEPIKENDHWKCPKCGWLNPYPDEVVLTSPPITCYKCNNCDYHFDKSRKLSFRDLFPRGRPG